MASATQGHAPRSHRPGRAMTRSLHVITTDARRGAETFAVDLAAALNRRGDFAEVVALTSSGSATSHSVQVLGERRRSRAVLGSLRRVATEADVVVAHGSSTLEACSVALLGSGKPFVYRNIGDPAYWGGSGWRRAAVTVMLRRSVRVAALWPEAADDIHRRHRVPQARLDVIPNAVHEVHFSEASSHDRRHARVKLELAPDLVCLAFVGALSPEKNLAAAIRAVASSDAVLVVAGEGSQGRDLRRMGEMLAPGRVRFLGQVEDVKVVYAAADMLVLPSRSEGMPAVVIEAALVGTPTVATEVGALSSMIDDGVTGFLVPPGDDAAFALRVNEVLPEAGRTGQRAAQWFRGRYSIDHVAELWAQTLELGLEGRGK